MRYLFLGAGAVGGYFGGRLAQAGTDVSFLVRPQRQASLASHGLVIKSGKGDAQVPVKALRSDQLDRPFDLVVLTCKAYDLDAAMDAIAPAVGSDTALLPLLNGLRHLDSLAARFGRDKVLGGVARISAVLGTSGEIRHLSPFAVIQAGELQSAARPRPALAAFAEALGRAGIEGGVAPDILATMWEKWIMLCSLAAMCCALRGNTGQILASDEGEALMRETVAECHAVARAEGCDIGAKGLQNVLPYLTNRSSQFAASMLSDLEKGGPVEADHVVGDMLARAARAGLATPNLRFAYAHLQTYEVRTGIRPMR